MKNKAMAAVAALCLCLLAAVSLAVAPDNARAAVNGTVMRDDFVGVDRENWQGGLQFERTGAERFDSLAYDGAGGASAVITALQLPAAYTATVNFISDSGSLKAAFPSGTGYSDAIVGAVALNSSEGRHTAVISVSAGTYTVTTDGSAVGSGPVQENGNRFALLFDQTAKGNVLDVEISANGETLVYDTFTADYTVSPFFADNTDGYVWKAVTSLSDRTQLNEKTLHVAPSNELIIRNGGWRTDFAYTGYELVSGVGASYTVDMQVMIVNSSPTGDWLAWVNNAGVAAPGVRSYDNPPALSACGGFVDGTVNTIFGSMDTEGSATAYQSNRKIDVRVTAVQTGTSSTAVQFGFRYSDSLSADYATRTFFYNSPIGGNVTFTMAKTVVVYSLSITDAEGNTHVCPLNGMDSLDKAGESFFIGLKQGDASCVAELVSRGAYDDVSRVRMTDATPHGTAITSRYSVPERIGTDTRDTMYDASLGLNITELTDSSGVEVVLGSSGKYLRLTGNRLEAYDGTVMKSGADIVSSGKIRLDVKALADGSLTAGLYAAEEDAFVLRTTLEAEFAEEDFTGNLALRVYNPTGAAADVVFESFTVTLSGIPSQPTLVLPDIVYVPVGEPYDLTPAVMSDELDAPEQLTLSVTVSAPSGDEEKAENAVYTFTAPGIYTVSYALTNTHGLSSSAQFSVRAIYRGSDENALDKLDEGMDSADNFDNDGVFADGKAVLSDGRYLYTKSSVRNFMAYFDISALEGSSFELVFGNCFDYDNAFGVKFGGGEVVGRNLIGDAVSCSLDGLAVPAMIRLTVLGNSVSVALRRADTPYDYLYRDVATFAFADDMPVTFGKMGLVAGDGTTVTIDRLRVFSLESGIDIETEPYEEDETTVRIKPLPPNYGLIIGLSVGIGGGVLVIGAAAVCTVIVLKRRKSKNA